MSDKTKLLIVEVEKHQILYYKRCRDFKDAEKKKKGVETYCRFHELVHGSTHCDCDSPNYRVLCERWFVRTFERKVERKVALFAFVVVVALCINRPLLRLI